jgi:C-terminal processing protease CtpA/Prc
MTLQKFRVILLVAMLFVLCVSASAQPKAEVLDRWKAEDLRIARLAGLARVWGAVKFFHPYLAHKEIDWDKALIETIPRVNGAKSADEYKAAINHLLSFLNDRNTSVEIGKETKPTSSTAREKTDTEKLVSLADGVLRVEVSKIGDALSQDNTAYSQFRLRIDTLLPQAKAIVLNCRANDEMGENAAFYYDIFMRRMLGQLLDSSVTLGSSRYRMHNGYAPHAGTTSGGYYSAFVATSPQTIVGQNKAKSLPIAVIVNDKTPPSSEIFSGLQATKHVLVVQEGEDAGELGVASFTVNLPEDVRVRMRTTELVNPDGSIGFQPDIVVPKGDSQNSATTAALKAIQQNNFNPAPNRITSLGVQRSAKDNAYPEMEFPNSEYRLLALFRFWNIINYFFPYKHLIDEPWNDILARYIPKFEANKDAVDYQTTLFELAAETQDSHVGVRGATKFLEKLGTFLPPIGLKYIEKQSVVALVLDEKTGFKVGDVIVAVDGEPVERRRENLGRLFAASTPQSLALKVDDSLLLGPKDSRVRLTVRGLDSNTREIAVSRSFSANDPKLFQASQRTTPVVQVLPSGVGYVDLERLQVAEVVRMFETIKDTPATIFDMRGYPHGTAWEIAPRLTEKKDVTAALFSRPILEAASLSEEQLTNTSYAFAQKLPKAKGDVYKGRVVMLINEEAISQSEHTCMFFESATDVTFIGTPTTGANGDVTTMVLPGSLVVSFTGHDVRHADGRQLQRLGIQPHVKSEPTIRGLVEGRDEVLETAVKYLREKLK